MTDTVVEPTQVNTFIQNQLIAHFQSILHLLGEDIERPGLLETPSRIARAWQEMTSGLSENPAEHLSKVFEARTDEMVVIDNLPFTSICEHHFLPFVGVAHIGYIPGPISEDLEPGGPFRVAGLSKFPRLVQGFARRPQIQEQLVDQIATAIEEVLNPQGVIVVVKAEHMCMSLRGIKAQGSKTTTTAVRGLFATNQDNVKGEFFSALSI